MFVEDLSLPLIRHTHLKPRLSAILIAVMCARVAILCLPGTCRPPLWVQPLVLPPVVLTPVLHQLDALGCAATYAISKHFPHPLSTYVTFDNEG